MKNTLKYCCPVNLITFFGLKSLFQSPIVNFLDNLGRKAIDQNTNRLPQLAQVPSRDANPWELTNELITNDQQLNNQTMNNQTMNNQP